MSRTGVQWRYLPHDFPPWESVYGYFAKWQKDGVFTQLNGLLRELVRQKEGLLLPDQEPLDIDMQLDGQGQAARLLV